MTIVAILLALLSQGTESPADDGGDEVRADVERWVEQLESPSLSKRVQAERELLDLGPKILPLLPANELLPGPASREAVRNLRNRLQRRLATDSARPSRVSLSGDFPLEELLAEIKQQTGNPLRLADDLPESVKRSRTWTFDDVPFWEAIDEIDTVLNLKFVTSPETNELALTPRGPDEPKFPVSRNGVLRVELKETAEHPVAGDPKHKLIRIQAELDFEPRLRPLFVHFSAGDFSASEPEGESIKPWNPTARYELPMAGASRRTTVRWDFVTLADKVPKTVSFRGKLLVQLAAATEPIRFERLTTRKEVLRRRGGVSVRLLEARFEAAEDGKPSATVRITVSYDTGGPAFESHRTWVYHNAAWMEDDRRRYPLTDFDTLLQSNGSVQLEYRFQDLPPAETLKFVYEAPTLLLDVPFELEFRDVAVKRDDGE